MNKEELIKNVSDTIKSIAEECKMISKAAITAHGFNDKARKDTLTDSNLYNDLTVTEDAENGVITILVNDYIDYIQGGREPNKPFPWEIAVEVLAGWCQRKLGASDNTTIYFVWKSIVENGIKPRPIFDIPDNLWTSPNNPNDLVMEDLTDEYWDDWADEIFEAATIILDDYFND